MIENCLFLALSLESAPTKKDEKIIAFEHFYWNVFVTQEFYREKVITRIFYIL